MIIKTGKKKISLDLIVEFDSALLAIGDGHKNFIALSPSRFGISNTHAPQMIVTELGKSSVGAYKE